MPATVAMTTSFRETENALAICLISARGTVRPAKLRWLVIASLNGVRGVIRCLVLVNEAIWRTKGLFRFSSRSVATRPISGSILTSFRHCWLPLSKAAPINSATPN
ncbi:hypothetical protein D3C84_895330 [compost metagenome]